MVGEWRKQVKYENIEAERARLGLSKDGFAKSLGIATKTYYNWLNGVNPIPSDALVKMSGICKAGTDYLLGLTDIRRKDEEVDLSKAKTYELVAELKTREGVEVIMAEPYQKREVSVEGPAVFFIVTD